MKLKFRKILKISLSVIVTISLLILTIAIVDYLQDEKLLFYATGTQHKAFLNSTWEMSEKEIERANDTYLTIREEFDFSGFDKAPLQNGNPSDRLRTYNPSLSIPKFSRFKFNSRYPQVLNMSRYKGRIQNNITVFGSKSQVSYSFFDDKLFEYTLIIEGFEADKVNEKKYDNISKKFDNEQVHDKQAYETQSISWEDTDLKVDYRLTEQSSWRFTAVVRFSYKPMFNKIRQEKLNEEKNLF